MAAANLLGFSTQTPNRGEVATGALSSPRKLAGRDTLIHTRRPAAWIDLSQEGAARLDFLRRKGLTSDSSPEDTTHRLMKLLIGDGRYQRLLATAMA